LKKIQNLKLAILKEIAILIESKLIIVFDKVAN